MIYVLVLEKKDVSLPLLECKRLTINSWISKNAILGIGGLLRSTPYLENLNILHTEGNFLAWDEDFDLSEDEDFDFSGDEDFDLWGDDPLSAHEKYSRAPYRI